jgi:hypothetical protein
VNTGDEQEWVRLGTGESGRMNATRLWAADQRSAVRVLARRILKGEGEECRFVMVT